MRCPQVKTRLSAFHDGELGRSEAEDVRNHLLNCQTCRDAAAQLRAISRWMEPPAAVPEVSANFTNRVFDRIHKNVETSAASRYLFRTRAMRFVAIAAGVIACVSGLYLLAPRSSDGTLSAASEREVEERIAQMRGFDAPAIGVTIPAAAPAKRANAENLRPPHAQPRITKGR